MNESPLVGVLGGSGAVGRAAAARLAAAGAATARRPTPRAGRRGRRGPRALGPAAARRRGRPGLAGRLLPRLPPGRHSGRRGLGRRRRRRRRRGRLRRRRRAGPGRGRGRRRALRRAGRSGVAAAGVMPGLSGLLPRWLARRHPATPSRSPRTSIKDRFTPAAAREFLASLADTSAGSAWRSGAVSPGALRPRPAPPPSRPRRRPSPTSPPRPVAWHMTSASATSIGSTSSTGRTCSPRWSVPAPPTLDPTPSRT